LTLHRLPDDPNAAPVMHASASTGQPNKAAEAMK